MALSTIDGAVLSSELKRRRKNISVYKTVRFALAEGGERTMKNLVAVDGVAEHLAPGSRGRFYLHSYFDARGLHGFRGVDGVASAYAFPSQNERLFKILFFVNLSWIALRLFVIGDGVPLLGVGLLLLAIIGWIWGRRTRIEAERDFSDDAGSAPTPLVQGQPA